MKGNQRLEDGPSSPSVSVAGEGRGHHQPELDSDDHSEDYEETTSRVGAGAKRKRPISVS